METLVKFKEMGLSETTLKALKKKGFEEPTPIQEQTIPLLLKGDRDVVAQAQTGTGKTAAFGIPLIERLAEKSKKVQAIILTPTRELAVQVSDEINSLKGSKKMEIFPIYGGQSIDNQIRKLKQGVDVVVGTPGRVIDHLNRKTLDLSEVQYLILDEADEMLNMGFIEDIEEIFKSTNKEKMVLLFSATMPREIVEIAKKYMGKYEMVSVAKQNLTTELTDQIYFEVSESDRFEALCRIVDIETTFYGMIFCRTKMDVDVVGSKLVERGYGAEILHGDVSQHQRERVLKKFKDKKATILVCTDVAARGIDVNDLTHVINYSLPQDPESYVHRIGRTGRAGKEGTAITFVSPDEYRKLLFIKRISKADIRKEKLPQVGDVINAKKQRIFDDIAEVLSGGSFKDYLEMADELIKDNDPKEAIAAVLKYYLHNELDEKGYNDIREYSSINTKGTARLFVAMGKADDMTPKKVVNFIKENTDIDDRKIKDVKVLDKFSFITVPFEEAEIILEVFKKKTRGRRPVVERAKDKE